MGGIIDGMGIDLDGILLNPSVMTAAPGFLVQINITPLPNDVSHNQLAFGIPMFGGMMGVSAQMLNAGEFIHINESGQAQATLSIYDAAAVVGYSRYIWKTISVGLNAKGIYRSLGTEMRVPPPGSKPRTSAGLPNPRLSSSLKTSLKRRRRASRRQRRAVSKRLARRWLPSARKSTAFQLRWLTWKKK
jgi:hypothetical protein